MTIACVIFVVVKRFGQLSLFSSMWAIGVPFPFMVQYERSVPESSSIPSSFMFLRIWRDRLSLRDALDRMSEGVFKMFSGRQSLF